MAEGQLLSRDRTELLEHGIVLTRSGKYWEALASFDDILAIWPDDLDALNNRGIVLAALKRHEEAVVSLGRAVEIKPGFADAHRNLGAILGEMGRSEESLASLDRALLIRPDDMDALVRRGAALWNLRCYREALATCDLILGLRPDSVLALNNRGNLFYMLGRYEEALADYDQALKVQPNCADAHWNESICRLQMGDLKTGLRKFQWRTKVGALGLQERTFAQPVWLGKERLAGKSILLHSEQGLGDAIQFVRYVPMVAEKGAIVTLEVPAPLVPLMAKLAGVSRVVARSEMLPKTEFHCPLLSLPLAFDTSASTIPAANPYLSVDQTVADEWRRKLSAGSEKLVGVCWRGSPSYKGDAERSIRFAEFSSLFSVPGVRFISLQKELTANESDTPEKSLLTHRGENLRDTAEMIAALDLVISVDTVWAHWAGAIGKPFWLLLPFTPHWVWQAAGEKSAWYPKARLFRQAKPDSGWSGVVRSVKAELGKQAGAI